MKLVFAILSSFAVILLCFDQTIAADSTACGDWEPFKDEQCYKIFDKDVTHTFADGEKICLQNGGSLLNIRQKEEQDFVANFLFSKSKVPDNVWIGAKYSTEEKKYKFEDAKEITFTNWVEGYPKSLAGTCVEMASEPGLVGKWIDASCHKKNLIVCQKAQVLSIARLHDIILQMRQEMKKSENEISGLKLTLKNSETTALQNEISSLKQSLNEVKLTLIPIGFTYIQHGKEKSPSEIWPSMTWKDVSVDYAGVFFRVEGRNATTFGQIQEENAPRLINVHGHCCEDSFNSEVSTVRGGWSGEVSSAYHHRVDGTSNSNLKFEISGGEVRPRNMAIRMWKRTA